jgi:hypothetical protein
MRMERSLSQNLFIKEEETQVMKHSMLLSGTVATCLLLATSTMWATTKHETEIFGKWLAWQQIYHDQTISNLKNDLSDNFVKIFKNHYEKNIIALKPLVPLLGVITNDSVGPDHFLIKPPLDEKIKNNLSTVYENIEHNVPAFIDYLIASGMCSPTINKDEQTTAVDLTLEKYKAFARLLFAREDLFEENEYLIAFANRLFEYCYADATTSHYQKLLTTYELYPVVRFLNAISWYHLVGDGWKHWHANPLKALKDKAAQGNEIVYVAGGTDFYHLLRNGIYNITIIDPFYPTQVRFYSEGWNYLIAEDGINNEIRFGPSCNSIKMKCVDYKEGESFYCKLSNGQIISIKKSIITWNVFNQSNQQIGHVIINRRPINQDDFASIANKAFAISYDELTYIALPEILNGWGINPTLLPENLEFHVKQLRQPVKRDALCNMRVASLLNLSDVRFINLGSDPT